MGNFYTNVVVRGPSEDKVVETLAAMGRNCFVTSKDDFVFVYDEEADTQRSGVVESLALTLATRLACPALAALNHDDSALLLWLYDETGGELRFGWGVAFDAGVKSPSLDAFVDQVRHVFDTGDRPAEPNPVPFRMKLISMLPLSFAFLRHERILRRARIPVRPGMAGYKYVFQGELGEADPELRIRRT